MQLLGITGGVGMGKSTSATLLAQRGIPVADTDHLARVVVEPGQPALAEIVERFGSHLLDVHGSLDRQALAKIVFSDEEARRRLESIVHPRIRQLWTAEVERWRRGRTPVGAVVIPLLFETEAVPMFTATVCVACSAATQSQRLRARGWTEQQIQQRISAQWGTTRKMEASDFILWSEGSIKLLASQWDRILTALG